MLMAASIVVGMTVGEMESKWTIKVFEWMKMVRVSGEWDEFSTVSAKE